LGFEGRHAHGHRIDGPGAVEAVIGENRDARRVAPARGGMCAGEPTGAADHQHENVANQVAQRTL
jgi:hypothetical protein